MRAKWFLTLFTVTSVTALTAWPTFDPLSTGVLAQQGGRGAVPPGAPAADVDAALRARSSGLRPASSRCPSICSRRRTSTRIERTGSISAITDATIRASSTRCGIGSASVPSRRNRRPGAIATTIGRGSAS